MVLKKYIKGDKIKVFNSILIILVLISYFVPYKIYENLYLFDLLMILNLLFLLFSYKVKINNQLIKLILILNIPFLYPLFLTPYSINPIESFMYIIQFVFSFTIIPLYIYYLYKTDNFNFILKTYLIIFSLNSFLFLFFILNYYLYGNEVFLHFTLVNNRFLYGFGTVNEIFIYTFLSLFIVYTKYQNKLYITFFNFYIFIINIFSLSRTVVILNLLIFVRFYKSIFFIILIGSIILLMLGLNNGYFERLFDFNFYTTKGSSIGDRYIMIRESLYYILDNPFKPLFFHIDEVPKGYDTIIINTHNIIFSIGVNLSLICFLFVLLYIIINMKCNYNISKYFLFISFLVLIIQPFLNSRIFWFSIIIYLLSALNLIKIGKEKR